MLVKINLRRATDYAKIVDIPEEKFNELVAALDHGDRKEARQAEEEINNMVGPDDWQDDNLDCIWDFEEYKEEQKS